MLRARGVSGAVQASLAIAWFPLAGAGRRIRTQGSGASLAPLARRYTPAQP